MSVPVQVRFDDIEGNTLGKVWASITDFDLTKENFSYEDFRKLKVVREGLKTLTSGYFRFRVTNDNAAIKSLAENLARMIGCTLVPKEPKPPQLLELGVDGKVFARLNLSDHFR